MCRLQANFPATIAMARTLGQNFFFCQKTLNFKVISTQNHFMDILETLTNQSINSKHPKMGSKT
jgi:hypothetical protein